MRATIIRGLCLSMQIVLVIGSAAARADSGAAQTSAKISSEEDALIHRGVELRRAHDDVAARAEFQKAYDLTHSPRAAAQIGLAEFALGRFDDAEAHIAEGLRAQQDPWINKYRKQLDQSLAQVQTHVARVEVIGEPPGAEVYVNGRLSGHLPLQNPVSVSEGQVDVELRAPGHVRGSRNVTLAGRQYQRLVIRLERERPPGMPAGGPSAAAAVETSGAGGKVALEAKEPKNDAAAEPKGGGATSERAAASPHLGWRIGKWSALGLAGASAVTGVVAALVAAKNTTNLAHNHCQEDGNGKAVDDTTGKPVPGCQPYLENYKKAHTWEIVGFVGAGVFAATWLVLMVAEPSSSSGSRVATSAVERGDWACAPVISASPGAGCTFRF